MCGERVDGELDTHKLMFCVLERSLKDIIKWHHPNHSRNASHFHYQDSVDWVFGKGDYQGKSNHIFSFYTICEYLNLPYEIIRKRLKQIMEGNADVPEQLLGGTFWRNGLPRSVARSDFETYVSESSLLLFPSKQVSNHEDHWVKFIEGAHTRFEERVDEEEDGSSWD